MKITTIAALLICLGTVLSAAPPDRIISPVDARQAHAIAGNVHRLAQSQFDRGAVDPKMAMNYMILIFSHSAAQQADLDQLLANQQNPSSPQFHQWLTPEAFGDRFGLSSSDHSKVTAWLHAEGFSVNESARGRNWIAFSGLAEQVSKSLHTSIHHFQVNGEMHFANTVAPSVPDALASVVGGFLGLNDFHLKSQAVLNAIITVGTEEPAVGPADNIGSSHYLVPEDYGTIYDIAPLYQNGFDGTGQSIAVVGESDVSLTDLRAFRTRYNLPANDPKTILYSGADPGFNGAQLEGSLDLEWAGAIAPKATIYYVLGPDALSAMVAAVNLNVARVISVSYGGCEVDFAAPYFRSFAQQGNAQGITLLNASGDSGAAGCDSQGSEPFATRGRAVDFPAVMPEVTGVGGTQFVEGSDTYWAKSNSPNSGSALSYIPEAAWNESGTVGLLSSGGGASLLYSRPVWQNGPGVPVDSARHVPDIALSSAGHDAYLVSYNGGLAAVSGTSASAPSMAAIVALLNQYQVANKFQAQPGLGNINPQLYRLAQSMPSAFHDVASGSNIISCSQGSPDCGTGSFGYMSAPAYDMATGLGSIDANILVTNWNMAANAVIVMLSANATKVTVNDTIQATATVAAATGAGIPTGNVDFSSNGIALGSSPLVSSGGQTSATLTFPVYQFGATGTLTIAAEYSGDAAFSAGGATMRVQLALPTGSSAIVLSGPSVVWPSPADAQGLSWQTMISLREAAGVPAMVTGFTIDGQTQSLAPYFPSPDIPANGTLNVNLVFRNLSGPTPRIFVFTGVDANGNAWTRQISITFMPLPTYDYFNLTATPLTVFQNTSADSACQWAVQLNVDDLGGYLNLMATLTAGGLDLSSQIPAIFGTTRLDAWSGLQGRLCFGGITPPASDVIYLALSDGTNQSVTVSFAGPPPVPGTLSATPATVNLAPSTGQSGQTSLSIKTAGAAQPWTISVSPANRTTSWLTVSQLSGAGNSQISLTATGTGLEPGVYRAMLVIESDGSVPQVTNVPVMFVLPGVTSETAIQGAVNAASGLSVASPGMLLSVFGSNLAGSAKGNAGNPLPYALAGVSATVNGLAAPVLYESSGQLNIQIPYAAGSGPAVLGINNNGQIAGFHFQIAPTAPGIFTDGMGNLSTNQAVQPGAYATLYMTGAGEVTPALKTAYSPSSSTPAASLPMPLSPLSVTVGGIPAFVQFAGLIPGSVGVMQVNFIVPTTIPFGVQPIVVTVGGVASPAVNMTVSAPLPAI